MRRLSCPFKLKNPRKGTETKEKPLLDGFLKSFQIKESPEGDWNFLLKLGLDDVKIFQIKESPEGDWNFKMFIFM